jgi:uncharacterized protein (TIGR02145 family)
MKTNRIIWVLLILISELTIFLLNGCRKSDPEQVPEVFTREISQVLPTSAYFVGEITSNGGSRIIDHGFCWGTIHQPTVANNKIKMELQEICRYAKNIYGLSQQTKYYVRAYATNSTGTAYGEELSFITPILVDHTGEKEMVVDFDGNIYQTTSIGSQVWMGENLKTIHYNDGTAIPLLTWIYDPNDQPVFSQACYVYNNDMSNKDIYGLLYNWYTISTFKLCPTGWHVPSDEEWTTLVNFLKYNGYDTNMYPEYNGVAKALTTTDHWQYFEGDYAPGSNGYPGLRNKTNFSALPAGRLDWDFVELSQRAYFWTTTVDSENIDFHMVREIDYSQAPVYTTIGDLNDGLAVRCLKDN